MAVQVVNVRDFPFEYPTPYLYVGRYVSGLFCGHPLANPFKLSRQVRKQETQRRTALEMYRNWLLPAHESELRHLAEVVRRTGLPLGCWCHPLLCHASILAEYLDLILARQEIRSCPKP